MEGRRCSSFLGVSIPLALAWILVALAAPQAIRGQTRIGSEFQVNSYTPDSQGEASIANDAAGNFVVVWHSNEEDGSGNGVFGQRFSSAGAALGQQFQVNEHTPAS